MSTKQATIDFILEQLDGLPDVRARKMFGEYALYCGGKVVGLVTDDTLFVKITAEGKEYVGSRYAEGTAYSGARPSLKIHSDLLDDRDWFRGLIRITADALPAPLPKRPRKTKGISA